MSGWWQAQLTVSNDTAAIEIKGDVRSSSEMRRFIDTLKKLAEYLPASGIVAATAGETEGLDERSEQSPVAEPDAQ